MKITVIGAGPGGYEAAIYAAKRGAQVTVIEKDEAGGTCLNRGCIPTKTLLASCDVQDAARSAKNFGINISGEISADYGAITERKDKVTANLVKGIEYLFKANNVSVIQGKGKLAGRNSVEVLKAGGGTEIVVSDYIILASGSKAFCPEVFNYDGKRVITSDEVLRLERAPESIIIVGGGVIGCEIGQFLARMGTKVTIVEALPRLMASMDEDASKQLARQFKKDKIKVITGDGIAKVSPGAHCARVELASGKELEAQYCLVAVGRAANTDDLGLENAGIRLDGKGRVIVNDYLQTDAENIYAAGDLLASAQLAHVASKEGRTAVDNIFGAKKKISYHAVPACVFTSPQLACAGMLEWQLEKAGKKAGEDYRVGRFEFKALGKAQATGQIFGFVKVITDMDDVLIGAEIAGAGAGDMLQVLTAAVQLHLTASQLEESIFPHPSMCEAIGEALHDLRGMSINKA